MTDGSGPPEKNEYRIMEECPEFLNAEDFFFLGTKKWFILRYPSHPEKEVPMAVIDMAATRVWVKQVTTNIFYRGARHLFGTEFMKRNRKGLIGVAVLLWITGIFAGYAVYRRAAENFHTAAVERIRTELAQEIKGIHPGRLAAFHQLVETLAPFIFLRDVSEVQSVVEAARAELKGLRYLEVRDEADELYSVGVQEAPLRRRTEIDRFGPDRKSVV